MSALCGFNYPIIKHQLNVNMHDMFMKPYVYMIVSLYCSALYIQ